MLRPGLGLLIGFVQWVIHLAKYFVMVIADTVSSRNVCAIVALFVYFRERVFHILLKFGTFFVLVKNVKLLI